MIQGFIKKPNPYSTVNSRFCPSKDETDEEYDAKMNTLVNKIEQIQEFQRQFPELIVRVNICDNADYSTNALVSEEEKEKQSPPCVSKETEKLSDIGQYGQGYGA